MARPWAVYAVLLALLLVEVAAAGSSAALVMTAAAGQFGVLLVYWLEVGRARGWVRLFGLLYLAWLLVMFSFVLMEQFTR